MLSLRSLCLDGFPLKLGWITAWSKPYITYLILHFHSAKYLGNRTIIQFPWETTLSTLDQLCFLKELVLHNAVTEEELSFEHSKTVHLSNLRQLELQDKLKCCFNFLQVITFPTTTCTSYLSAPGARLERKEGGAAAVQQSIPLYPAEMDVRAAKSAYIGVIESW